MDVVSDRDRNFRPARETSMRSFGLAFVHGINGLNTSISVEGGRVPLTRSVDKSTGRRFDGRRHSYDRGERRRLPGQLISGVESGD